MKKGFTMNSETKEIVEIKAIVSNVQIHANSLEIKTSKDMSVATDQLHYLSTSEKFITGKKEEITRPLMKSLASVRDMFRPLETNLADAKKIIKSKMITWQTLEDDRIQKEKDRISKRVEKGTMRVDIAAGKMEVLGDAPTRSEGEVGKSSIREVKKVRIVDEFLIPREYLVVNITMVTEAILRKGAIIPGTETYVEKTIVSR